MILSTINVWVYGIVLLMIGYVIGAVHEEIILKRKYDFKLKEKTEQNLDEFEEDTEMSESGAIEIGAK